GGAPDGAPSAKGGGGRVSGAAALPVISRIRIRDGVVRYESTDAGGGKTSYALGDLDLLIEGGGPSAPVEVEGVARLADGDVRLTLEDVRVGGRGARSASEAALTGRLVLEAKDIGMLATRVIGPTPQLAGAVKGTLALAGTLAAPSASGQLEVPQLALSESRPSCDDSRKRTLTFRAVRLAVAIDG